MRNKQLYPLKFDPIYHYRIWGGRRLGAYFSKPLPNEEPIGEAWVLSDRKESPSRVKDGFLKGKTIAEIMETYPKELMGEAYKKHDKFPLLLKFLDAQTVLSVQVHPSDEKSHLLPQGELGKTEAWVVLESSENSKIYGGLKSGTTKETLQQTIDLKKTSELLHSFQPKKDDAIYIPAGTVHTFDNLVLFEVQENSDVTYRLFDWDRTDEKTGKTRELQIDKALESIDFNAAPSQPIMPEIKIDQGITREKLFDNPHFILWRIIRQERFFVGKEQQPRILVCINGAGRLLINGRQFSINRGEVVLIPAICGIGIIEPLSESIEIYEIAIPF